MYPFTRIRPGHPRSNAFGEMVDNAQRQCNAGGPPRMYYSFVALWRIKTQSSILRCSRQPNASSFLIF